MTQNIVNVSEIKELNGSNIDFKIHVPNEMEWELTPSFHFKNEYRLGYLLNKESIGNLHGVNFGIPFELFFNLESLNINIFPREIDDLKEIFKLSPKNKDIEMYYFQRHDDIYIKQRGSYGYPSPFKFKHPKFDFDIGTSFAVDDLIDQTIYGDTINYTGEEFPTKDLIFAHQDEFLNIMREQIGKGAEEIDISLTFDKAEVEIRTKMYKRDSSRTKPLSPTHQLIADMAKITLHGLELKFSSKKLTKKMIFDKVMSVGSFWLKDNF